MEFNKGIRNDEKPINKIPGSWEHAKNILISKGFKPSNEDGFDFLHELNNYIIGVIPTGKETVLFSVSDDESDCEIGIYKDGVYTIIIRDGLLGFKKNNPIEGVYKYNSKGELIVGFCDGINDDSNVIRLINLTNFPVPLDVNKALVNPADINLLKLFPDAKVPTIDLVKVNESGGSLKEGAYYFFIAYEIEEIDTTNYLLSSKPIFVAKIRSFTIAADNTDLRGVQVNLPGETTNQSISLAITNLDTRFKYYKLGVVRRTNGIVDAVEVGRFYIQVGGISNITYTGQNTGNIISLADIVVPTVSYPKAKTMTIVNEQLGIGNINSIGKIDFQKYANNIKVRWNKKTVPLENPDGVLGTGVFYNLSGKNIYDNRCFQPDEVYALYIHLILNDGSSTEGFHIPGRVAAVNPISDGLLENALIVASPTNETFVDANVRYFHTRDVGDNINKMSYWENQDELYPDTDDFEIWDVDGAGNGIDTGTNIKLQKVRHHKFPSLRNLVPANTPMNQALGFEADVKIPKEILNQIQGYYFSYATRESLENVTVLGESILVAQNWFDAIPRPFQGYVRFYDFSLLTEKPIVGGRFLKLNYLAEFTPPVGIHNLTIFGYYNQDGTHINLVAGQEYHPDDNSQTTPSNQYREATLSIKVFLDDFIDEDDPFINIGHLIAFRLNLFSNFYQQKLISTGKIFYTANNTYSYNPNAIYGGDTFLTTQQVVIEEKNMAVVKYYRYPLYNRYNIVYRYYEAPHPAYNNFNPPRYFYNKDFSVLLDLKIPSANDVTKFKTDKFPHRIARSNSSGAEDQGIGWRAFLANSYYEMPKDKGVIWKIKGVNRSLYIHHEQSLFIATLKDVLQTDNINAYLGEADIFDRKPDEILSTDLGELGNQSQWATILCKYGYIFADRQKGRIWLFNGGNPIELSKEGNRNWFKENLQTSDKNIDNPFTNIGLTIGFDDKYDRLIVTKRDGEDSFTYSYSFDISSWVSYHKYIPNYLFNNRDDLYSIRNGFDEFTGVGANPNIIGQLFKHNSLTTKGRYYRGYNKLFQTAYQPLNDCFIDVVFNKNNDIPKVAIALQWRTLIETPNNTKLYNKTITGVIIYNDWQCSGLVNIINNKNVLFAHDSRFTEGTWNFDKFRDLVNNIGLPFIDKDKEIIISNINVNKSWFNKSKFISNFIVARLYYNNIDAYNFYLNDIDLIVRKSDR